MERTVCVIFVGIIARFPETAAAATNIPVTGIFNKRQNRLHGVWNIINIHMFFSFGNQLMNTANNPNIQRMFARAAERSNLGIPTSKEQQLREAFLRNTRFAMILITVAIWLMKKS